MKRYKNILLVFIFILPLVSCTDRFLKINTNPYEVSHDNMMTDGYAVGSAMSALAASVISTDVNTTQFTDCLLGGPMGHYYASTIGGSTCFDNFNATNDWSRVFLCSDRIIPNLYSNIRELEAITDDAIILAMADVIKVAAMHRITDTYGPIPYTKIAAEGKLAVEYDSQEAVYDKFFEELNNAIQVFTDNKLNVVSPKADPLYGGNIANWAKFANSLKLRLAMRIVYADEAKAKKFVEEAVNNEFGVFESNSDNALLKPIQFGEKGNPFYTAIKYNEVAGTNTGGDTHVAADICCYMNGYEDPRRAAYFVPSMFEDEQYKYSGMRIGIERPSLTQVSWQYSGVKISPSDPIQWLNAAEVAFLRAEAAAIFKFNVGGTAEEFYNKGIRLSFDQWGAAGAEDYLNDDTKVPDTYTDPAGLYNYSSPLSDVTVKWDEEASLEVKQERIIIQKWIANFNLGNEAWADMRRTGFPVIIAATDEGNMSAGTVNSKLGPRRLKYPDEEFIGNAENVKKAVDQYLNGSNSMSSRMWWDCNENIKFD